MNFPFPIAPRACRVAVLTAPGRGALATIVLDGPDAAAVLRECFVAAAPASSAGHLITDRLVFGYWPLPTGAGVETPSRGEEVVVCRSSAERIEVHCHGGSAVVEQIIRSLTAKGCHGVSAASWVLRDAPDRLQAEANLALTQARTLRVAGVLLDQYHGALGQAVDSVMDHVTAGGTSQAAGILHELLGWFPFGVRLTRPWRVVLVGRTNVGKSSLLNAVLGYTRALVDPAAGTTRDVLTARTAVDGWPVELADTAGSRREASEFEREGISRAARQADQADLTLVVADAADAWSAEDERWLRQVAADRIIVHNKSDLIESLPPDRPAGTLVSARTGAGVPLLLERIAQRLVPRPPASGTPVPFRQRHFRQLSLALHTLADGKPDQVLRILGRLRTASWHHAGRSAPNVPAHDA